MEFEKIGAGWETPMGNGEGFYIRCVLDKDVGAGGRFTLLKSRFKTTERHPDWIIRRQKEPEQTDTVELPADESPY